MGKEESEKWEKGKRGKGGKLERRKGEKEKR